MWSQLAAILRDEVSRTPPGRLLPSVRTMMQTYGVSDGTVKHALAQLRAEGLIKTVKGRGSYVALRKRLLTVS